MICDFVHEPEQPTEARFRVMIKPEFEMRPPERIRPFHVCFRHSMDSRIDPASIEAIPE